MGIYEIAPGFIWGDEYPSKGRTDGQFVEDLYDAVLRRGTAPWEVRCSFLNTRIWTKAGG